MCLPTENDSSSLRHPLDPRHRRPDARSPASPDLRSPAPRRPSASACSSAPAVRSPPSRCAPPSPRSRWRRDAAQRDPPSTSATADPKAVVRRLIDEVLNDGRLEAIDELYAPELARGARRWITPFRESFPDVRDGDRRPDRRGREGRRALPLLRHPPRPLARARRPPAAASNASTRSTSSASTAAGSARCGASRTLAHASGSSGL